MKKEDIIKITEPLINEGIKEGQSDYEIAYNIAKIIIDQEKANPVKNRVSLPSQEKCKWTYDDDDEDETYWTSCDQGFTITNGDTDDNHFKYCIFCGKKIDEVRSN